MKSLARKKLELLERVIFAILEVRENDIIIIDDDPDPDEAETEDEKPKLELAS